MSGPVPEKIGKYPVESLVARGGMGAVYKAVHPELKRPVIIKKLTIRGNAAVAERFTREARILLDLHHPHIVHLYDYFLEAGSRYLVLEFVDGLSLDRLLQRKKRFSGPMALLVLLETCVALKFAHDHGVIHRDVKPGNILISRKGSIKLADFGIASDSQVQGDDGDAQVDAGPRSRGGADKAPSISKPAPGQDLTAAGSVLGTPSYMPPEQFADSSTVDARADIYSAGVMLYEMVTGQKPYPGGNTEANREAIRRGKYRSVRSLAPEAPRIVVRLIRKMMQPNPKKRFSDLGPVIRSVTKYLKRYPVRDIRYTLVQNMLTSKVEEGEFQPARRTGLAVLGGTAAALVLAGLSLFAWNGGYVHRFLLRPWYAPVSVRVELPAVAADSVYGSADLQFRAFFFRDDGADIPEAAGSRRVLAPADTNESGKSASGSSVTMECKTVWLRPGVYRLKLVAGPRIWWESFRLEPSGRTLTPRFGESGSRVLSVITAAFDSASGRELTGSAEFFALHRGAWVPVSRLAPDALRTGTVQKFRVTCPGYRSAEWSLRIGLYQDELRLDAGLEKL